MGCVAVVANDAQHMVGVAGMAWESAQLASHFSRGRIGHAGQDRGQRTGQRAAFVAVVSQTHVHQQTADVGIAKTQGAEIIGQLRNFLGWELCHHHGNFQGHGPQAGRVDIGLGVELTVLVELKQVHRRKVTGRVIKEHIFRTRVRAADLAVFWAGVPCVDGVVELNARIGTGPSGVTNLIP